MKLYALAISFLLFHTLDLNAQSKPKPIKLFNDTITKPEPTKEERLKQGFSMCFFEYKGKKYNLHNRNFSLFLTDGAKSYPVEKMTPLADDATYTATFNVTTHCIEVFARQVNGGKVVLSDKNILRRFNFPIERIIGEKNQHAKIKKTAPKKKPISKKA
jgi:hypothetical protein